MANLLNVLAASPVDDAETEAEGAQVLAQIRELPVTPSRVGLVEALDAWGSWAAQRQAWDDAALAFDRACRVVENLIRAQAAATEREDWLARTDGVFLDAAYCRARAGDLAAAAVAFEHGRGVLARLQGSAELGADGANSPAGDYAMLRSAARDRPLVMIAGRRWGGLALVVRADGPQEAVWLPELVERTLAVRASRYLTAYVNRHADAERWERALTSTTRWLWRTGLGDLLSRVGPEAAVLAAGRLAVLPLHAAWRPRRPAGRMYVLDRTALSYGPSAAALITARTRSAGERPQSLLAVCEPADASEAFAMLTAREVDAVAAHFSQCTTLRGASATGASVVEAMSGHQVWHFACHGFAARDMVRAGLVLPSGELLTVQDLTEVTQATDLGDVTARTSVSARMAVLSACETALIDGRVPDELVGLPSALVRLGVSGVVATQWAVSAGPATALLAARFYQLWLHDGLAPPRRSPLLKDGPARARMPRSSSGSPRCWPPVPRSRRRTLMCGDHTGPTCHRASGPRSSWSGYDLAQRTGRA